MCSFLGLRAGRAFGTGESWAQGQAWLRTGPRAERTDESGGEAEEPEGGRVRQHGSSSCHPQSGTGIPENFGRLSQGAGRSRGVAGLNEFLGTAGARSSADCPPRRAGTVLVPWSARYRRREKGLRHGLLLGKGRHHGSGRCLNVGGEAQDVQHGPWVVGRARKVRDARVWPGDPWTFRYSCVPKSSRNFSSLVLRKPGPRL
jgi:hypothetical protein